jgi:hypothetical protein
MKGYYGGFTNIALASAVAVITGFLIILVGLFSGLNPNFWG